MSKKNAEGLLEFIRKSPTTFHTIANIEKELKEQGFEYLDNGKPWDVNMGGRYYTTSNGTTLIAFDVPKNSYQGYQIVASHSDTPGFKIKANPEKKLKPEYTTLSVEKYGGPLLAPWFDRPLSIAGRVLYQGEAGIEEVLVDFKEPCLSIVNLAIHQNREANNGIEYKVGKDMLPLWAGHENEVGFMKRVVELADVEEEQILDMDLFVYNRMDGAIWGANQEFLSAPRLDDLLCVYASKEAFLESKSEVYVKVLAVFDNEEVGSGTMQGAKSTYMRDSLDRLSQSLGNSDEAHQIALANSVLVSADNAHALHPNYMEKSDQANGVYLNRGVVIKYSANQSYTTDARSGSYMKSLCNKHEIPYQVFHNHADVAGGSTLGNLAVQQLPIMAVDIGAPQLAMHSPYETVGARDVDDMMNMMKAFWNSNEAMK